MASVPCEKCNGLGEVPSGHLGMWGPVFRVCPACDGTGTTPEPDPDPTSPAPVAFDRAEHCRQIGTLGGQKTVQTYGHRYMSELGKIGFQAYAERHHDGNRAAALGSIRAFRDPDARVRQPGPFRQLKHAA
jgi:hypothetical protein